MSTVYIIKDGIIVKSLVATESYRSSLGTTVKPKTLAEEMALILYSEINKRIKKTEENIAKIKQEMEEVQFALAQEYVDAVERQFAQLEELEHEKYIPDCVAQLMEQWQQASFTIDRLSAPEAYAAEAAAVLRKGRALQRELHQRELECLTDQASALERIKTMRDNMYTMEQMVFHVDTTEGTEELDAEVNQRTRGKLDSIQKTLDEIGGRIQANSPEQMRQDLKLLEELEQTVAQLPRQARQIFTAQLWREEQAQNVAQRLEDSGWQIVQVSQGDGMFDDSCLLVKNPLDRRAMISFTIDGEVRIDSFFEEDDSQTRAKLQQLIVGALQDGGAVKAKGKCMDGEPEASHARNGQPLSEPLPRDPENKQREAWEQTNAKVERGYTHG